jgi:Fic family protein
MKTLALFSDPKFAIPATTAWYLDSLGEFRGKQELYTRQSPQKLRVLREHALIESAVSSNRIEGVSVATSRVQSVLVATQPLFRDRDEEEVRGYQDALKWIHEKSSQIPLDENTLKRMHAMARGQIWDAGQYKERDGNIIERFEDGQERIRFRPTAARETPAAMEKLIDTWNRCLQEKWAPPAVALAACNLDFLCIHPFRDGNGRVSRLTLLLQTYCVFR